MAKPWSVHTWQCTVLTLHLLDHAHTSYCINFTLHKLDITQPSDRTLYLGSPLAWLVQALVAWSWWRRPVVFRGRRRSHRRTGERRVRGAWENFPRRITAFSPGNPESEDKLFGTSRYWGWLLDFYMAREKQTFTINMFYFVRFVFFLLSFLILVWIKRLIECVIYPPTREQSMKSLSFAVAHWLKGLCSLIVGSWSVINMD